MSLQSLEPLVVCKNVANVHLEPSGDTELVTQAFTGQPAWAVETKERWIKVKLWDSYTGWVQARFTVPVEEAPGGSPERVNARIKPLIADVQQEASASSAVLTKLVVTSEVETGAQDGQWTELCLPGGTNGWVKRTQLEPLIDPSTRPAAPNRDGLVRSAKRFVGTPYLWGGTTPFGIDCSGFVQLVYRLQGFQLLRDAGIQANDRRAHSADPRKLKKGDLVFFCGANDARREKITHVGMFIGEGQFIHSAGQSMGVTISPLFSGYYWDVFWGARTMEF